MQKRSAAPAITIQMAKKITVFISFSLLLMFGVLSFILTHSELTSIDRPWYIDIERRREDGDRVRASTIIKKGSSATGVTVGRILAKYDADSEREGERDPATALHLEYSRLSEEPITVKQEESLLSQNQSNLNNTAPTNPSSSYKKLDTLSHLKTTELKLDTAKTELWLYLKDQLKTINFTESATAPEVLKTNLMHSLKEQLDLLSYHASSMQDIVDSLIDVGWRGEMSAELSRLMQMRLYHLQNPKRCNETKKLLCPISKPCGFGCQMHHVAYCFIFAYATERMLILDASNWRYASKWETAFEPLVGSSDCIQGE